MSRTRYARHGTLRIAYELRGRRHWRRPWLVLIQGVGFDRFGWAPVLRKLRRHFRLVLADNRGSGRSSRAASQAPGWSPSRISATCSSGRTRTVSPAR